MHPYRLFAHDGLGNFNLIQKITRRTMKPPEVRGPLERPPAEAIATLSQGEVLAHAKPK